MTELSVLYNPFAVQVSSHPRSILETGKTRWDRIRSPHEQMSRKIVATITYK